MCSEVESGKEEENRGNFPGQSSCFSGLQEDREKNWKVMRKGIKDDLGSISFPGYHMAADGSASLAAWIQESSCS